MMETIILSAVGLLCGMILGFWLGRFSARFYVGENEEFKSGENVGDSGELKVLQEEKQESVMGSEYVVNCGSGKRRETILNAPGEKIYAPTAGKVIKLFPQGNELLFRTEKGVVLRIVVGDEVDELQSGYFRPKVVQNEVVNRGKLLMEFDRSSLESEGVVCQVSVRVEDEEPGAREFTLKEGNILTLLRGTWYA